MDEKIEIRDPGILKNQDLESIKKVVQDCIVKSTLLGDWIPEPTAMDLLNLKSTALWSLRKRRLINYSKIGGRNWYSLKSIQSLLDKNQK